MIIGVETEFGAHPHNKLSSIGQEWLANGGRLYRDIGDHPEYATPECASLLDVVRFDKAGERVVLHYHPFVDFYKHNTDGKGHYFGTHENYFMPRVNKDMLARIIPFLVTRQIYAGSGDYRNGMLVHSQRAHAMNEVFSRYTCGTKPIINLRDESHTTLSEYMRLHLIVGDANMSQTALYLKVGTTQAVLEALVHGDIPKMSLSPLTALVQASYDYEAPIPTSHGRMTPVEIQEWYAERARGEEPLMREWASVLDGLKVGYQEVADRVDWAIKANLMKKHLRDRNIEMCANINLQFHNISNTGLFRILEDNNLVKQLVTRESIEKAQHTPPTDTRAFARGILVREGLAQDVEWRSIRCQGRSIGMGDPRKTYAELVEKYIG